MNVETALVRRISLSRIAEFAAIFSGITLVAGYIWMHVVVSISGIPEQAFTISDYAASGVSTSIIVSAISFLSLLSYAITFPWEEPRSRKLLRRIAWHFCVATVIAVALVIFFVFYLDLDNPTVMYATGVISAVVKVLIMAAVFAWVSKVGPLEATMENFALILALGVWATSANGAMAYASRAQQPLSENAPNLVYSFEGEAIESKDWYPLLTAERNYYFVRRADGAIKIMSSEKLIAISDPGNQQPSKENSCRVSFLTVCARINHTPDASIFSITATIPGLKL